MLMTNVLLVLTLLVLLFLVLVIAGMLMRLNRLEKLVFAMVQAIMEEEYYPQEELQQGGYDETKH